MKLKIEKEVLVQAVAGCAGVIERRQTLPILGNLRLIAEGGILGVLGTDLEVQMEMRVAADTSVEGAVSVPARKLLDIARAIGDGEMVQLEASGGRINIRAGKARFSLATLPATDFPSLEHTSGQVKGIFTAGVLRPRLDKGACAMAQQDVRQYLNGMLMEFSPRGVVFVSTDGHRLVKVDCTDVVVEQERTGDWTSQFIMPAKAVGELRRLVGLVEEGAEVRVEFGERTMAVRVGDATLTAKLIEGRYPEYERVIPKGLEHRAVLPRELLKRALQRTGVLVTEKYRGVRLNFAPGVLGVAVQNQEREEAQDEVMMEFGGAETVIGFNLGYVLDVLNAVQSADVEVWLRDGESSSIWRSVGDAGETFVIMPMRL